MRLCLTVESLSLGAKALFNSKGRGVLINGTDKNDHSLAALQYTWIQSSQEPEYSILNAEPHFTVSKVNK